MPAHGKRPRDTNQLAKLIVDLASGERTDELSSPERAASGAKGGLARASRMTSEQREEASRIAAQARWRRKTPD